ncbi:galactofuranose ABC transporter, permease protein YjfF [Paenibacillus mucilaginosus]|uniref:Putative sugar uptake ABC transporter permease protein n=1 Tax=Paenibacillus mucilaginosus (strain KNP414) TaxID=1036673 RepID=F8F8S5_PAEMK|nr:galactofuranose ABC transporter, permease protein YjfF [Paenibacillus mucilaginosus]AEI41987.1 putative sugar uptake ABC transporter permease protein [Paenibacillus mucilaginosus KNP414]MCG7217831.1 sugar ABC transporter permease YjfF [Paenibacillus mucilaginosus]WDM28888.1 sugar ABC transporter permease YjfF [Paenibacillus mucilaginosus]
MSKLRIGSQFVPALVTMVLFCLMFLAASAQYTGFFSAQVFLNLFIDNAFLIITAVGMTFVIISGGIDLSVGSVIALTTMISASLVEHHGWSPMVVIPLVLVIGSLFGWVMGYIIHEYQIQPFIVTLAGMFLARGLCYVISIETITITNETYTAISQAKVPLPGGNYVSISVVLALLVVGLAIYLAHYTKFGRNTYAIGGSESSALLMGLPVGRTKILVYTFSGFCSAMAGVVFTFYMLSGYGLHAVGLELDTIAAVVIGGTLLTGGVGYIAGTLFGVLIQGIIQTIIMFEGTLSSWWTKIAIGILLFLFILLQRVLVSRKAKTA